VGFVLAVVVVVVVVGRTTGGGDTTGEGKRVVTGGNVGSIEGSISGCPKTSADNTKNSMKSVDATVDGRRHPPGSKSSTAVIN
jgi:hypothetical protein